MRALYDWVVANTYREPKVRGCGVGDIKAMLETGNLGGKCGDINALFVGMARVGRHSGARHLRHPRREVGVRLQGARRGQSATSRARSTAAPRCGSRGHGWVAMDPADVGKVMRLETADWIKDAAHPGRRAGVQRARTAAGKATGWATTSRTTSRCPGSSGPKLGFFMYPQAETRGERVDSLDPDTFKYRITAREIKA